MNFGSPPLSAKVRRELVSSFQRQEEAWLARFLWREVVVAETARGENTNTAVDRADALCAAWRERFGTKEVDPSGEPRFGADA